MSANHNLTIKQGSSYSISGQLIVGSTGEPRDLTGYDIRSQMRPDYQSETFFDFSGSIVDPVEGTWQMELTAAETEDIPAGCYVYDVEIFSGDTVERILEGKAVVSPEVTRDE